MRLRAALGCLVLLGVGLGAASRSSDPDANGRCRASHVRGALSWTITAATGQTPVAVVVTNRSGKTFSLKGYPRVDLLDGSGTRLPLRISHRGDQMVTWRPPVLVRVRPRRSAFFVLNKYRCDRRNANTAATLRVALPGHGTSARLTFRLPTSPMLGYCGRNGPGSIVAVSPIAPSIAAALNR